jgi:hypothetical protein
MAKPNDLAACQATIGSDWILAKVIQHDPASGMYKLSDEDVESNKSKYLARDTRIYACRGLLLLTLLVWLVHSLYRLRSLQFTRFTSRCPWRRRQADSGRRYLCGLPGHDFLLSSDSSAITTKEQSRSLRISSLCGRLG